MADARPLLVLGAGGHGRVVLDVLQRCGLKVLGVLDPNTALHGTKLDGVTVLGGDDVARKHTSTEVLLVNAVGNSARKNDSGLAPRRGLFMAFMNDGYRFAQVISPDAVVARTATLEDGVHVLTRAVVHPGVHVGVNAILNTGALIDHDGRIGAHSHIAPGAVLCGGVIVGESCHVGAGAVVTEGVKIGNGAVIGAGAVVTRDVAAGATVFPAR